MVCSPLSSQHTSYRRGKWVKVILLAQFSNHLPTVTPSSCFSHSLCSSVVHCLAGTLAQKPSVPLQGWVWPLDVLGLRTDTDAEGRLSGLQERGLAAADWHCQCGWLAALCSPVQPCAALLSRSLESRRSRHRGIRAVCVVYKKPSGAPSWDCSHLSALFPCKMLLTVLHQGQFILNGMYRHSIHLYFLPSLLFHPPPTPLLLKLYMVLREEAIFYLKGKKRADGFKEKPSIIGENIWSKR